MFESGSAHPVLIAIGDVREALETLRAAGIATLSDGECRDAVAGAAAMCSAAQHEYLRLIAELDTRPDAVPGAAKGRVAKTFLVHALRVSGPDAARDVAAAHAVDRASGGLQQLGQALAEGVVSREHVDVAVRAVRGVPRHLLTRRGVDGVSGAERVDRFLTDTALSLSPQEARRVTDQLLAVLDPDGSDRFDPEAVTRRGARLSTDSTGMLLLRAELDPAAGAVLRAAIDRYSAPDPAGSAESEGGLPVRVPDGRTAAQRRADGLATIARVALDAAGPGATDARARIVVTASPEQVAAALGREGGAASEGRAFPGHGALGQAHLDGSDAAVGPRLLGRWLCDALLQRVLLAPGGAVLDLGRTVRTVSPAQRRALAGRDRGCVIPGCAAPAGWCDAHHVTYFSRGGPTDVANMALVCARHHTDIHAGIWGLEMRDGVPWATPPAWLDPLRRRLRNTAHDRVRRAVELGRQLQLDVGPAVNPAIDPAAEPVADDSPPPDTKPPPESRAD
jgi:hypothetical protein